MTTFLRSFVFSWHPKLILIKARSSTSHAGLSRTQSTTVVPFSPYPSSSSSSTAISEFTDPVTAIVKGSLYPEVSPLPSCPWTEFRSLVSVGLIANSSSSSSAKMMSLLEGVSQRSSSVECRSYDPRLRKISSPLTFDDDIIQTCGKNVSSYLEDDLRRNVYQRDVFVVDTLDENVLTAKNGSYHRFCSPLTEYEKNVLRSSDVNQAGSQDPMGKPTEQQLEFILLTLSENLPQFFKKPLNYHIYHKNIVFQNNIRGITTHGIADYIRQMMLLRFVGHLKFAFLKMEVLKVTKHVEDGTVRVRWRIRGIQGYKFVFQFWNYRIWDPEDLINKQSEWLDAFSTFYVGGDGLIHRHVCDKMMRDENKENTTRHLAAKLALLLGVIPRPSMDDLGAMLLAFAKLQETSNIESTEIFK